MDITRLVEATISLLLCYIPMLIGLVSAEMIFVNIASLFLFIAPGYLILSSIRKRCNLDARSIGESLILSVSLLFLVSIIHILLVRYISFQSIFVLAILLAYVVNISRLTSKTWIQPQFSRKLNAELTLLLVVFVVFTFGLLTAKYDGFIDNDSYFYISTARILHTQGPGIFDISELKINYPQILRWNGSGFEPIYAGVDRAGFILLQGSYDVFSGFNSMSGQILALFFSAFLPISTYLVATMFTKRRFAFLASIFVAFIPYLLWHSDRVLAEIPATVFALLSMYFLYETVERGEKSGSVFSILAFLISLSIKPLVFLWIIPYLLYAGVKFFGDVSQKRNRSTLYLIVLLALPFLGSLFLTRFRTGGTFRSMLSSMFGSLILGSQSNFLFIQNLKNDFSLLFLTPAVLVLSLVGLLCVLTQRNWKRNLLVLSCLALSIWFTSSLGEIGPRNTVIVYPFLVIFMVSILEIQESSGRLKKYLPIIILAVYSSVLLFSISSPVQGIVNLAPGFEIPRDQEINQLQIGLMSLFVLITCVIVSNYAIGIPRLQVKLSNTKSFLVSSKLVRIALVSLFMVTILIADMYGANALKAGGKYSYISLSESGLLDASIYVKANIPAQSILLTNLMASAPLNYLTSMKTVQPPPTLSDFEESLNESVFDYVALFPVNPTVWNPIPDYLIDFKLTSPPGMHELYRKLDKTSFDSNFTDTQILEDWQQVNQSQPAQYLNDQLAVGGEGDSGLMSKDVFDPSMLNITVSISSVSDPYHSPIVSWNDGTHYIAIYYQKSGWTLESNILDSIKGIIMPSNITLDRLYRVNLAITSTSVTAFVDNQTIGNFTFSSALGSGHVILRSTYFARGTVSQLSVSEYSTFYVIYAKNGDN